jgi:hypothetical protein
MSIKQAKKYFDILLKTKQHLISKKTGLMLQIKQIEEKSLFKVSYKLFKVSYNIENEGAWLGNSPVGSIIVSEKSALNAVKIFPIKLKNISMKCYNCE